MIDAQVDHGAVGHAGLAEYRLDGVGAGGDVLGVLHHGGVAGEEGRGEEADDLPEREVPGHNGEDRAEALVADAARPGRARDRHRLKPAGAEVGGGAAGGGAFTDLAARLVDGLAHLQRHQAGVVLDMGVEPVGEGAQQVGTLGDGHGTQLRPGAPAPDETGIDFGVGMQREAAEEFAGGRVERAI